MSNQEPRKIDASEIEILDSSGEVVKEREKAARKAATGGFGGIRVIQGGVLPFLLLLPLVIPFAVLLMIVMAVFALFFGKGAIRVFSTGIRRR